MKLVMSTDSNMHALLKHGFHLFWCFLFKGVRMQLLYWLLGPFFNSISLKKQMFAYPCNWGIPVHV